MSEQDTTLEALMDEALNLHQAGNLREAEARYRRILELQPNHRGALHAVGAIAYQAGDHREALKYLSKAAKNACLRENLGRAACDLR